MEGTLPERDLGLWGESLGGQEGNAQQVLDGPIFCQPSQKGRELRNAQ